MKEIIPKNKVECYFGETVNRCFPIVYRENIFYSAFKFIFTWVSEMPPSKSKYIILSQFVCGG
jgi:hypothetical protein